MASKPVLRVLSSLPMPTAILSLASALVLLGAALDFDGGLTTGVLVFTGVVLGCLGLLGMAYSGDGNEQ